MDAGGRRRRSAPRTETEREQRSTARSLHHAVLGSNIEEVRILIANGFHVDTQHRNQTALQLAVEENNAEICKILLDEKADPNQQQKNGDTLLHTTCTSGSLEITKLLVERGADMNVTDRYGKTALFLSVEHGWDEIAELLLHAGCETDESDTHGRSALHCATEMGNLGLVLKMIDRQANVDALDTEFRTPLHLAAEHGHGTIVEVLQGAGADINRRDRLHKTALYKACSNDRTEAARALVNSGADCNIAVARGTTPLLEAIARGNTEIVQSLLKGNCDVNKADRMHEAPIHAALRLATLSHGKYLREAREIIDMLVEAKCNLNAKDNDGWTALHHCARSGNFEIATLLLSNEVDTSIQAEDGNTVLHNAVIGHNIEIVSSLLQTGCDTNVTNKFAEHSLITSVKYKSNPEITKMLVENGAKLGMKCRPNENTALHEAINHSNTKSAIILMASGCDVNMLNGKRQSPLYLASERGIEDVVAEILRHPSRQIKKWFPKAIPIHGAVLKRRLQVIEMLVEGGCNIHQMNEKCMTPIQVATENDVVSSVKTLLRLGADIDAHARVNALLPCCLMSDDDHPHFGLEPMFFSITHRNLDLMKLLIQFYRKLPYSTLNSIVEILHKARGVEVHFSPAFQKSVFDFVDGVNRQPRELQQMCRLVLRQRIGVCIHTKVVRMNIPDKIRDYILMSDLLDTSDEPEDSLVALQRRRMIDP